MCMRGKDLQLGFRTDPNINHKDCHQPVLYYWLTQKGLLRARRKSPLMVVDRGIEPLCQD